MGLDALCRCLLFSRQAEDLLQQHSSSRVDEATSYADVKPCNSYLRRLIYQVLEHRYVTCTGSSTKCWNTGMLPAQARLTSTGTQVCYLRRLIYQVSVCLHGGLVAVSERKGRILWCVCLLLGSALVDV